MTEAGKKLLESNGYSESEFHSDGEFWIRLFCDEVEKRAGATAPVGFIDVNDAFYELRRQLLGSNESQQASD